ncbi:protein bark beetle-like, partial [Actinia tenebrosa]|uniref:Protein bark beetle-like n=1 Tax=Actinia tenebrosa TaxID=6105 RepID=A0A6P8HYJ0_ACTTE
MKLGQVLFVLFLLTQGTATFRSDAIAPSRNYTLLSNVLAGDLVGNITLKPSQGPFVIDKDLLVPEGSQLTLKPGAQLLFRPETGIQINGSLIAEGSPENKVSFSSFPYPNASSYASHYYGNGIRLVDGNNYTEGRLEILMNNRWGVICADRWTKENTDVACRHLGFLAGKRHFKQPFDRTKLYLIDYFACKGYENNLWNCDYRRKFMGCPQYPIGIECVGLMRFLKEKVKWRGMSFMMQNHRPLSILKHVTIKDAVFALNVTHQAPEISSVTIRNSIHGIQVSHLIEQSNIELTDILVHDNYLTGMKIMSLKSEVRIRNSSFTTTSLGDGFSFEDETVPIDFCTWGQNSTLVYPLMFSASSDGNDGYCSKPVWGFLLLITATRSVLLSNCTFLHNGKSGVNIENFAGHLQMTNSKMNQNALDGVNIKGLIGKLELNDLDVVNNGQLGLVLEKVSGKIVLESFNISHNKQDGVKVYQGTGFLMMKKGAIKENNAQGIYIGSLREVQLNLTSLKISMNKETGLTLEKTSNGLIMLTDVTTTLNSKYGAYFTQCSSPVAIERSSANANSGHGFYFQRQGGSVKISDFTASLNQESGLRVDDGISRLFIDH